MPRLRKSTVAGDQTALPSESIVVWRSERIRNSTQAPAKNLEQLQQETELPDSNITKKLSEKYRQAVLLDIEGTILSTSFVADILFPAALESLPSYVAKQWSAEKGDFADVKQRFPLETHTSQETFVSYCKQLNSQNSKFPPWKTLQGILWRQLYKEGSIKAPLYDDVLPALRALKAANVGIYIYSSGSIEAQNLLFGHTNHGNIKKLIDGYFDPSYLKVENKFDVRGYDRIISDTGISNWTFFSDVPMEVMGAQMSGMRGYVVSRKGNKALTNLEMAENRVLYDGLSRILDLIK